MDSSANATPRSATPIDRIRPDSPLARVIVYRPYCGYQQVNGAVSANGQSELLRIFFELREPAAGKLGASPLTNVDPNGDEPGARKTGASLSTLQILEIVTHGDLENLP